MRAGTATTGVLERATWISKHDVQQPYGLESVITPILPVI